MGNTPSFPRTAVLAAALMASTAAAQVYSPRVLVQGQPDASDPGRLARGIYAQAGARTPRERAEAIWRFFLTDGRFVKPGFWYHIAGWAYEEPMGEVLDPVKLLNSYGFGLCYQIAPLLEAVYEAGGFEDARVWFLTGHTVTEVFYDGAYHHYDSDMLGYNPVGKGPVKQLPVASVHQLERDGGIILSKLLGPRQADAALVDDPWYPADVRAGAMGGLAEVFTTTRDNHLFPFQRYPRGHTMDFVLRPGERLVRWFQPRAEGAYYLPHKFNGKDWLEFPHEIAAYNIRTADGPHSQKDARRWATGLLEYHPPLAALGQAKVVEVRSPYVIIDATFDVDAVLPSAAQTLAVETSTDDGRGWVAARTLRGPHQGAWKTQPAVAVRSTHGRRTAVTGQYQYLVRLTLDGAGSELRDLKLSTRIQVNPRTLPALAPGRNELVYSAGPRRVRRGIAIDRAQAAEVAQRLANARYVQQNGQGYWVAAGDGPAEMVFRAASPDGALAAFDAGGRFLDLGAGLAPDKFTAEVRKIAPVGQPPRRAASIAWSASPAGPFQTLWEYDPVLKWKDAQPIDRTLCWPEVDKRVDALPPGTRAVYVRYRMEGMALDDIRLAVETAAPAAGSALEVTHLWRENGAEKKQTQRIAAGAPAFRYAVETPAGAAIVNEAIVLECPRP